MLITMLQLKKIDAKTGRLIYVAALTLDDMMAVHDIKILSGENGYMLAMPNKATPSGAYRDIVHPISSEVRKALEQIIFEAVEAATKLDRSLVVFKLTQDCSVSSLIEQKFSDFAISEREEQSA